jgi:hypothetical protein
MVSPGSAIGVYCQECRRRIDDPEKESLPLPLSDHGADAKRICIKCEETRARHLIRAGNINLLGEYVQFGLDEDGAEYASIIIGDEDAQVYDCNPEDLFSFLKRCLPGAYERSKMQRELAGVEEQRQRVAQSLRELEERKKALAAQLKALEEGRPVDLERDRVEIPVPTETADVATIADIAGGNERE